MKPNISYYHNLLINKEVLQIQQHSGALVKNSWEWKIQFLVSGPCRPSTLLDKGEECAFPRRDLENLVLACGGERLEGGGWWGALPWGSQGGCAAPH